MLKTYTGRGGIMSRCFFGNTYDVIAVIAVDYTHTTTVMVPFEPLIISKLHIHIQALLSKVTNEERTRARASFLQARGHDYDAVVPTLREQIKRRRRKMNNIKPGQGYKSNINLTYARPRRLLYQSHEAYFFFFF